MKLLIRNHCSNEFLPGYECTVVKIDRELAELVARRAESFRRLREGDGSLSGMRWWDDRPACFNETEENAAAVTRDPETTLEDWLEERGGWAVLPDLDVQEDALADTDCPRMVLAAAGESVEVGWTYLVGSDEIRTAGIDVQELLKHVSDGSGP